MKEKRYTLPEEQEPAFAAEPDPATAYHGNAAIALPKDDSAVFDEEDEDIDWSRIPFMGGPANEEEAIARIKAIEADYEKNGIFYTVDDFFQKLHEERSWQK